jgi:hypothetical protein
LYFNFTKEQIVSFNFEYAKKAMHKATGFFYNLPQLSNVDPLCLQDKVLPYLTAQDVCALEQTCNKWLAQAGVHNSIRTYFNSLYLTELESIESFYNINHTTTDMHSHRISNNEIEEFIALLPTNIQKRIKQVFTNVLNNNHLHAFYFSYKLSDVLNEVMNIKKNLMYSNDGEDDIIGAIWHESKRLKFNGL